MNTYKERVKIPRKINAQIKDIDHPIVLHRSTLWQTGLIAGLVAIVTIILWATLFSPSSGEELLAEVVAAAGGLEIWNSVEEGSYSRIRTVYDENGSAIRTEPAKYYFRKGSKTYGLVIESFTDEGQVIIGTDGNSYWALKDGQTIEPRPIARHLGMMCDYSKCTPLCAAEMSFYRFSIPFKLTDPGAIPKYVGSDILNGRPVALLEITFEPNVGRDRWVFFVDKESKLIRKIEHYARVEGDAPPEEIYWSDNRTESGITFSHRNTYYRSNGSKLEEYIIKDVDFHNPLPDKIFKKPDA